MVKKAEPVRFPVRFTVERPSADEADWLARTVQAIDRGIVRVGSAKSGGRLGLVERPVASGPHADKFTALRPSEVAHG